MVDIIKLLIKKSKKTLEGGKASHVHGSTGLIL
jgi:hypothetical protein